MNWKIRQFKPTATEYETILTLRNEIIPDNPSTVEIWQHWDNSRPSDSKFERWLAAADNGRLIAYAQFDATKPGSTKFNFNLQLLPDYWQSDLPETLYQTVLSRISNHQAQSIVIHVQESETEKLALLTRHHFKLVMRSSSSHLDVATFNGGQFTAVLDKVSKNGIRISQPPPNWQHDPYWQHLIHDLDWTLLQDIPHHEVRTQTPFAQFVHEEFNHPNFLAEGYFIAFAAEQPIGLTNFVKQGGKIDQLAISITGVIPSYRRQGIATALKVNAIRFAQKIGAKTIITDNEENNPMYLLNRQLGFEPQPAWEDWEKQLAA
jgi:GNAT superfamily N-acetyltransferase